MRPTWSARSLLIGLGRRLLGSRQLSHLVRFEPVLEQIAGAGAAGGSVLDVGSGSRGVSALLPPGWHATALDADFEDYGATRRRSVPAPDEVVGDVRALPFADGAFDVVVAVDLLEHVPAADRTRAIGEICRVARTRAVLACPAGEDALAADRRLADRLRGRGHAVPPWLEEHLENGFPEPAQLAAAAAPFGSVRVFGNDGIAAHERLVIAEHSLTGAVPLRLACRPLEYLMASRRPGARRLAARVLRRLRGGDSAPTYRAVVVVDITARQRGRHNNE